jgi:L-2-amino-thiazoline-4-carboxylic acid hydrolase
LARLVQKIRSGFFATYEANAMAGESKLTPFERITQAVQAQIPLVRAMEAELGRARAHALVRAALDKANRKTVAARGRPLDIATLAEEFASFGAGVRYEFATLERTEALLRNHVTHCDYAEFMESIGARDLGTLLICDGDFAMADELGLRLERTKTCMAGDGLCNFCYHVKDPRSASEQGEAPA